MLLLKVKEMRNVYVLIKTVLLTGIRSINMQITQGINIFENEGNTQAND